ncbi:MAG: AzlD domain-containing protein [Thermoplasmatales archaeon]|nr:AzlD domain-containing protein [Thermoplasmatales archaeon]MCW6170529.1 AzlD domain-containing protein [Thermoplasmatales archaeon]
MNTILVIIVVVLALLSISQRVLPWVFYSRFRENKKIENLFDLFAISAFTSLFVYNVLNITPLTIIALVAAFIVALKTKNLPLTIVTAILVASFTLLI